MKIKTIVSVILLCFMFIGNAFARYEQDLIAACERNDTQGALRWLTFGANPNATKNAGNFTYSALAFACQNGNLSLVKELVSAGANVDCPSEVAFIAPLIIAVKRSSEQIVTYLLNCGANPNATDKNGNTALMLAIQNMNSRIVACFKNANGNMEINVKNDLGHTALSYAIKYGSNEILDDIIKSYKTRLNLRQLIDSEGCSLFMYAIRERNVHAVESILSTDGRLAIEQDSDGIPPLLWAIKNRSSYLLIKSLITFAPECVTATDSSGKNVDDYLRRYPSSYNSRIEELCEEARGKL